MRLRVGKVVPGEEGKLKVLPLFHAIPLLTFNSFIIQTAPLLNGFCGANRSEFRTISIDLHDGISN